MGDTALIVDIWEHFRNGLKKLEVLILDNKMYPGETSFLPTYEKGTSAFFILFRAFHCTDDLAVAIIADTDGTKDKDILDFHASASFEIYIIHIDIR